MVKIRLDKFISSQLNLSRTEAKANIRKGFVCIDNIVEKDPSHIFDSDSSIVSFKGQAIKYSKYRYIIMNKPKGVLSASNDKKRKTVVDLVPENLKRQGLFPVGRLDKDTTGLLILTDDGEFAHRVISPKSAIPKTYIAELDGNITGSDIELFSKGVTLKDGTVCKSAILKSLGETKVEITITEGKYHQIKRMFGVIGLGVNSLHRASIGALKLPKTLLFGQCVEISAEELQILCL